MEQAIRFAGMNMGTKVDRFVVTLHVGDEKFSLVSGGSQDDTWLIEVPVGLQKLVREVLRHSPPTPIELESAISLIEDELMKVHRLLPTNASLETMDACMWDVVSLINPTAQNERLVTLEEVEQLFDLLAALSSGRTASIAGIPSDAYFAAALLLLREMMHHLNFKSVQMRKPWG
jgi:exopolyphosphatase/pppGpp-phosphohydrolase